MEPSDVEANVDRSRVVITGAASGIGLATARRLDAAGAQVTAVTRPGGSRIDGDWSDALRIEVCDLSRPHDIARLVGEDLADEPRVDVLIANAAVQPWQRTLTPEGLELGFATGVLGTYLLIRAMVPRLLQSPAPVIVVTGSMVHRWGRHQFPDFATGAAFDPNRTYYAVKLAQMQLVTHFAGLLRPRGIAVHALEPGMVRTRFARHFEGGYRLMAGLWRLFMRRPEAVADEMAALLSRADLLSLSGTNWFHGRPRALAPLATDPAAVGQLVDNLEALCAKLGVAAPVD